MRKLWIACVLLFAAASGLKAQETRGFEVAGDYQYVRYNPGDGASGVNCQGGSGSFGAYLTAHLGVIGDFGGCKVTGLPSGTSAHELNYLVGPRLYFRPQGRVFPFVQASSAVSGSPPGSPAWAAARRAPLPWRRAAAPTSP